MKQKEDLVRYLHTLLPQFPCRSFEKSKHHLTGRSLTSLKNVNTHRNTSKKNAAASRIIKVKGELEQLLDDTAMVIDEMEEVRRVKKDESADLHLRSKGTVENIRKMTMTQAVGSDPYDWFEDIDGSIEEYDCGTRAGVNDILSSKRASKKRPSRQLDRIEAENDENRCILK